MACSCTTLNQAQNPVCGIRCERRRDADASNISACHPSAVHEAGTVRNTEGPGHQSGVSRGHLNQLLINVACRLEALTQS